MKQRYIITLAAGLAMIGAGLFELQGAYSPQAMAQSALSDPFVGLTTDGKVVPGLFTLSETNISVTPVREAAQKFIASLDSGQRKKVSFPMDHDEWRNWSNRHSSSREGVSLKEMTPAQRDVSYDLLRTSLSAKGFKTARDIMRLNHHLGELVSDTEEYGEHLYYFIVFGDPAGDAPWGWQIEGHHLIINYVIVGGQIVMTPTFMGSEPVQAKSGKYAGARILEAEEAQALAFVRSLPPALRDIAVIGGKEGRSENLAELFRDNIVVPYEGLRADKLAPSHSEQLLKLIGLFVGNMKDGHAARKMADVRKHLNATYFSWKGPTDPDAVFYFRVHSPVIWIEFDHQGPIALRGSWGTPTRSHIHTVVRTPNGNDYGKDILRQHYEKHRDNPVHGHKTPPG